MKRSLELWSFMGFVTVSAFGTVLHFLYEWLSGAVWVAPFSGINESTWEHMKLLFWPMFIYAAVQSLFFKSYASFWCVKLKGILLGLILIPVLFYTYNGVIGRSPDWVNIGIFFVAAASVYIYENRKFKNISTACEFPGVAFFILCVIALSFIIFTFKAPELAIFKDPLSYTFSS